MTFDDVANVVAAVLMIAGAVLCLTAGIGLLRFPDLLSRMHAATKTQVLGLLCVLGATALSLRSWSSLGMIILIGLFQTMTAPVAAHMIARAAYRTGQVRADLLISDESDIDLLSED